MTVHPLRRWRKEKDVTLAELARMVDVTPSHLSEIERGNNEASLALAARLSEATGNEVTIDQIARGVPA
jgi:transcriptional regulator with XRE-family HTH domain